MPRTLAYTPATLPALRWLTDGRAQVPAQVRHALLGQLFVGQRAVVMGVINGLAINVIAHILVGGSVFLMLIAVDLVLAGFRLAVVRRAGLAAALGQPTPTDTYILTVILWCGLQGIIAFTAMNSGIHVLQILSATTIMALIGPVCARYFPAPRLAVLLFCLCDLPFVAGAASTSDPLLMVLVVQTPLFYLGCKTLIEQLHNMSVSIVESQQQSYRRAQHDPLTGLLNRAGLADFLAEQTAAEDCAYTMFYLDLDGFKAVNDEYGHAAGDLLLMEVARRLRAMVRASDMVARLGGDEFVIIAANLPPAEGHHFAESVIRRITDQPYQLDGVPARIGISVGFACSPEDGRAVGAIQAGADAALYDAKRAGKGTHRRFVQSPELSGSGATHD